MTTNITIIAGNAGRAAERFTFPDGNSQVSVSIATTHSWKDAKSGEWKERADWHDVVFRGNVADYAEKNIKKGTKVEVVGELRTRMRKTKGGEEYKATEIHANKIELFVAKATDTSDDVPFDSE